jgi:hypothetical protein
MPGVLVHHGNRPGELAPAFARKRLAAVSSVSTTASVEAAGPERLPLVNLVVLDPPYDRCVREPALEVRTEPRPSGREV